MTSTGQRLAHLLDASGGVVVGTVSVATDTPNAGQIQSNSINYALDTGTANTYVATYSPPVVTLTDGEILEFQVLNSKTGASTFNANGTAYPILGGAHQALQSGEIVAGGKVEVMWHSSLSSWILLECTAGSVQIPTATQSLHATNLAQVQSLVLGTNNATVSAAGTTQGTATALTSNINIVTTVASGTGVVLPVVPTGKYSVIRNNGANALLIYPGSGASIDGGSTNAAVSLPVGGFIILYGASSTQWFSSAYAITNASAIVGNVATANALNTSNSYTVASLTSTGVITASSFSGSGAGLTGISAGPAVPTVITTTTTAVSGTNYEVNTSGGAFTLTLPASPSAGNYVTITDYAGTFVTYNLTIAGNGSNIMSSSANMTVSTNYASFTLVYANSTKGWSIESY